MDLQRDFHYNLMKTLEHLCPNENLVDRLSKVLGCARSTAYKKINRKILLSADELLLIVQHFQISMDSLISHKSSPVPFQSDALRKMPERPVSYLLNLIRHLDTMTSWQKVGYIYLAGEVPIFHYMAFKSLFMFKLYVWEYAAWEMPGRTGRFDLEAHLRSEELTRAINRCIQTYYQFSGIEIWNIRMIDLTIDQLLYFIPMKAFKSRMVVNTLIAELEDLVYHLENICDTATKRIETKESLNKSKVKVYMNELLHANDTILITSDHAELIFSSIDSPNYIRTSDVRMCRHIKNWLNNTIRHSTQISGEGEKERRVLFEVIKKKVEKGKREIKALMDYYYDA